MEEKSDQEADDCNEVEGWRESAVVVKESDPNTGPGKHPVQLLLILDFLNGGVHHSDQEVHEDDDNYSLENCHQGFGEDC